MGRPESFGSNIQNDKIHPEPSIHEKIGKLCIGDIVRFDIYNEANTFEDNKIDIKPIILQRQASTYGMINIIFKANEYYIVAARYNRKIITSLNSNIFMEMLVLLPLTSTYSANNGILTWLVDSKGWIRIAEDFSPSFAIIDVKVISTIPTDHKLHNKMQELSFDENGESANGETVIFHSNDTSLININKIYIPFA